MAENLFSKSKDYSIPLTLLGQVPLQPPDTDRLVYRAYLSEDSQAPLVLMVHGRAGQRHVMWTFSRALPKHCNVVTPEGIYADPVLPLFPQGKSWWGPNSGTDLIQLAGFAAKLMLSFIESFKSEHRLKPRKVVALGFSQGAGVLSAALQINPQAFDALALLCGFVVEMPDAYRLENFPVFAAHGSQDDVVPLFRYERGVKYLQSLGAKVDTVTEEIGHKLGSKSLRELGDWIAKLA